MLDIVITINDIDPDKHKELGFFPKYLEGRPLFVIDQTVALVRSIQENWCIKADIFALHSLPLKPSVKSRLESQGIIIINAPAERGLSPLENKTTAWTTRFNTDNPFRLILDADMLALSMPIFDYTMEAQAGLAGFNVLTEYEWVYICSYLQYKGMSSTKKFMENIFLEKWKIIEMPGSPWLELAKGCCCNYFPFFNAGAILINTEAVQELGCLLVDTWKVIKNCKLPGHLQKYGYTIAISLILAEYTNYSLFPPGCNFLGSMMNPEEYEERIPLFHYLGKGSQYLGKYKGYFDA